MAAGSRDDQRLMTLASCIDEGREVDWDAAERDARDEEERAIVAELRLLADVARVCRNPDSVIPDERPSARTESRQTIVPEHWGPLTVLEPIGRGAFATVYRAQDNLNREVALKLFSLPRHSMADRAARMRREGQLLARVKHANIVTVFGADQYDGIVGLWMEFIHGRTLEAELATRGTFSPQEAMLLGRDLCRALAAVHGAGLLHRDVKAHNVMRETGGRIVLMDFGAGKEAETQAMKGTSELAGTPLYLAPEVFAGAPATPASDIYSLGVLLYHLVTSKYPVEGANRSEIQIAHQEHRRTRLRDARPDLPDGFVQVIERAITPDAAQRYQTAGAFDEALANSYGFPTSTPGPASHQAPRPLLTQRRSMDPSDPHAKAASRYRAVSLAAAGTIAALLAVGMAWQIGSRRGGTPREIVASAAEPVEGSRPSATTAGAAAGAGTPALNSAAYSVKASFYRYRQDSEAPLASGDQVALGDQLGLRIEASKPVYLYVVNEDERGEAYLLYPLPGQKTTNPLQPGEVHSLPGQEAGREVRWQVTSRGQREHFLVFANPTELSAFNTVLKDLPAPEAGRPLVSAPLPKNFVGQLRGVGGLVDSRATARSDRFRDLFAKAEPLRRDAETMFGPWIRQITLENPVK
jgi:serine/threonine-protein kinase